MMDQVAGVYDQRAMWTATSKPAWLKITAVVVLAAFLTSLLAVVIF